MVSYTPKINAMGLEKNYAIFIPIIKKNNAIEEDSLLFEVRSSRLKQQPNEICFPGGHIEKGESPLFASIRETCEELLVSEEQLEVLTPTDIIVTPANKILYPYLGFLNDYQGSFSTDEVAETFLVPLSFFRNTKPTTYFNRLLIEPEERFPVDLIPNGSNYHWEGGRYPVPFYFYEKRTIWGITARIIEAMLPRLEELTHD